jgi:hypothetical protein
MQANNLRKLIKECVIEVLKEDISSNLHGRYAQDAGAGQFDSRDFSVNEAMSPSEQIKAEVYKKLAILGFRQLGDTPNEYMEYYINGFATVACVVDIHKNEVIIERYYDSERLDTMPGNHVTKVVPVPPAYSEEFVKRIVVVCNGLKKAIAGDEAIFGGNDDDLEEGFDPTSAGPNPAATEMTQTNPYDEWNNKMRTMEESQGETIYKDRQGGQWIYWINNSDTGGRIYIKPENLGKYIRQGYEVIELER